MRIVANLLCTLIALSLAAPAGAQTGRHPKKSSKASPKPRTSAFEVPVKYYRIVGLGSSEGDTTNTFPYPTAILQLLDTTHVQVVVRFPGLGMLGVLEDTETHAAFFVEDTLRGYEPRMPLFLLTFPRTNYILFIDVWSRDHKKLLDSRPFQYDMDVEEYHTAHLTYIHEPTVGAGAPTLRRPFKPSLLPFSIETNPAWSSIETLDSSGTYSLVFHDPGHPRQMVMSLSMRPTAVGKIDSSTWANFRAKAELAFGAKGVATSSVGDFQITDIPTRRFINGGYEFVSKSGDSTVDYVAAFLTPRAILMLFAPLDAPNQQLQYEFYREIARSFKLD